MTWILFAFVGLLASPFGFAVIFLAGAITAISAIVRHATRKNRP
jgi:hypothetical protein